MKKSFTLSTSITSLWACPRATSSCNFASKEACTSFIFCFLISIFLAIKPTKRHYNTGTPKKEREIFEETGVIPTFIDGFVLQEEYTLKDVNLTITEGDKLAIVGENEMNEGKLTLKNMTTGEQSLVTPEELLVAIKA